MIINKKSDHVVYYELLKKNNIYSLNKLKELYINFIESDNFKLLSSRKKKLSSVRVGESFNLLIERLINIYEFNSLSIIKEKIKELLLETNFWNKKLEDFISKEFSNIYFKDCLKKYLFRKEEITSKLEENFNLEFLVENITYFSYAELLKFQEKIIFSFNELITKNQLKFTHLRILVFFDYRDLGIKKKSLIKYFESNGCEREIISSIFKQAFIPKNYITVILKVNYNLLIFKKTNFIYKNLKDLSEEEAEKYRKKLDLESNLWIYYNKNSFLIKNLLFEF